MKKKGQSLAIGIMSFIFVFIVGMLFLNFLLPEVSTARVDLNCADASAISDGTKLLCLAIGTTVPYWIIIIFGISIGFVTARLWS